MEWEYFIVIFPEETLQRVQYRWPAPHHFCNCIYCPCPVCLCRTHACRILLQLEIMKYSYKKRRDYGVAISSSFCQRCSVQTVASFSIFIYLWEFSVWFERLQVWNVSCGCKCPKSTFGDTCFAYLRMEYCNGRVTLFWNQLWRVTFKMINVDTVRALGILCYLLWIYIFIYLLRVGIVLV